MKLDRLSSRIDLFAETASDVLSNRRGFFGKLFGMVVLYQVSSSHVFGAQYQIKPCPPGGPPKPGGKPEQIKDEDGNLMWYNAALADPTPVSGVGTAPPTTPGTWKPLMNLSQTADCGNAGTSCSEIIDTKNKKCCNCPKGDCPAPLAVNGTGWNSCCGGAEYKYKDCCGKDPSTADCPAECYKKPGGSIAGMIPCKEGSQAAAVQGWCNAGDTAYCTPGGAQTGKCCEVTAE